MTLIKYLKIDSTHFDRSMNNYNDLEKGINLHYTISMEKRLNRD